MFVSGTCPHEVQVWEGHQGTDGRAGAGGWLPMHKGRGSPHKRQGFSEELFAKQGAVGCMELSWSWNLGARGNQLHQVPAGARGANSGEDEQCLYSIEMNPRLVRNGLMISQLTELLAPLK